MKRIVLTEGELDRIVKESLSSVLNEMAIPLKKYAERIENIRYQLAENWCLCRYCQIYDPGNANFSHWKSELTACIKYLKMVYINNGIDKRKTLVRVLANEFDFCKPGMIAMIVADKFEKEGLEDPEVIGRVSTDMSEGIMSLIDVISDDRLTISKYISATFNEN